MTDTRSPAGQSLRVLVIEDDELLRETLCRVLVQAGYDVRDAAFGNEALSTCRSHGTDVVVTDIVMPDMDGLETIHALRRDYPAVKIIAISGGGGGPARTYLQLARKLGAHGALAKPFSGADLLAAIEEVYASAPPTTERASGER